MFIEYVNYIAYNISRSIKYLLDFDTWWYDELNEHGGVLCTVWGKLSNYIY